MFMRRSGYPKLRGKAAEIKSFGRVLVDIFNRHHNPAIEIHREVLLMLRLNVQMEDILSEHRSQITLPPSAAAAFEEATSGHLLLYAQLAKHFAEEGLQLFDLTSKFHLLQHLSLLARHVSPRCVWCFSGEDLMSRVQLLAQSCSRGVHPLSVVSKMARHYRIALHLRFNSLDANQ
jgi:hypothetical protein